MPLIAFLEACVGIGLFVSGAILLTVCSILYTQEIATLQQMLPLAFMGATIADHSGFYLGHWFGPKFHHTKFAEKRRKFLDKSESFIRRFGGFAIVLGRFIPAIRSLVPLMIGVSGFARLKYSIIDFAACATWTTGLALLVLGIDNLAS